MLISQKTKLLLIKLTIILKQVKIKDEKAIQI